MIRSEEQRVKKKTIKSEQSFREMWDNIHTPNVDATEAPGEERENRAEKNI